MDGQWQKQRWLAICFLLNFADLKLLTNKSKNVNTISMKRKSVKIIIYCRCAFGLHNVRSSHKITIDYYFLKTIIIFLLRYTIKSCTQHRCFVKWQKKMQQKLRQSSCECRNSSCSRTIESGGGVDVDDDAILFAKVLYSSSMMFLRNSIGSVYGFVYILYNRQLQQVLCTRALVMQPRI